MAKFLKGSSLNTEIENILQGAREYLLLISPYIKLHHRFRDELKNKIGESDLEIVIVFGKNENDVSKSFFFEDIKFFMQFPNIEICYEPRLHAKFYGNEKNGILTSMNLYDYSQDKNIETGVLTTISRFGGWSGINDVDRDAFDYFADVIERSEKIFKRTPQFEKQNFGLTRKYVGSKTEMDITQKYFKNLTDEIIPKRPVQIQGESMTTVKSGFCIRTGISIPFNPKIPLCDEAFSSWAKFKDDTYREKFCHSSGEPSNGETSFSRPILRKNWKASLG